MLAITVTLNWQTNLHTHVRAQVCKVSLVVRSVKGVTFGFRKSLKKIHSPIIVALPGIVNDVFDTSHKSFSAHKPPGIISMHIRNANSFPTSMSSVLEYKIYNIDFLINIIFFLAYKACYFLTQHIYIYNTNMLYENFKTRNKRNLELRLN